ncbi:hypothetical protein HPB47_008468 [Ixodes persulcatus]|uniref:Uncharacterized protein n=1 Tax=Ixodes persulcatus TaxID=34615 RepID=A0AC60P4I7_IXOPE|nr:hypothetical protein HPB47_008468 [Ixodes persulcatus]
MEAPPVQSTKTSPAWTRANSTRWTAAASWSGSPEDESPVSASRNFVPPSPPCFRERGGPLVPPSVRARSSPNPPCAKAKAELQESPSLLAKVNGLPPVNAAAVNAEVGGSAETDAAAKTTKTEHLANDASTRTLNAGVRDHSRDLELPTVDPGRSSCTPPRVPEHSVTKPAEEISRTAASPSLLQILLQSPVHSGQPSTPRPPGKEGQSAAVGERVVAVGAVPKPTVDQGYDPSQSLLRPLASVCTPKIEKSPAGMSGDEVPTGRVSVDLTFSTQESDKSSPQPAAAASAGESAPDKLSLARKRIFPGAERRRGPGQVAGSCKPSPPRKRKKQTKLSDRYFLAVNRHSPFTRNLARRKELSQTKLGKRPEAEVCRESKEDLDETCLPVGILEISDTPVPDALPVTDALPALDIIPKGAEATRDSDKERVAQTSGNVDDPSEVAHKFHGTPVRGREARQRLPAHECKDCQDFYERAGHGRRQELLKKCSRHRALHAPPPTPDNFWELDFPDTQECRARGYLNETLNDTPRNGPR